MPSKRHNSRDTQRLPQYVRSEAGYMLLAVVVMTALMLLAISVAAPVVARELRRDKEVESERRAQEYVRAIRLYTKRGGGPYPPSIEALEKTNNIRFLRQQYIDPLTGKSDWRLIRQGQQKTTIKIPFGQELGGIGMSGIGSGLGTSASSLGTNIGSTGPGAGTSSTIGSTSSLAGGFSGATIGSSTVGGSMSGTGAAGATGTSSSGSSSSSSSTGGGPIVGVGTSRTGDSILTPNGQTTYDTWEFWYDPRMELLYKNSQILGGGGAGLGGGGLGSSVGSGGTLNSTSGSAFGSSGLGSSSNSNSGGTPMTSGTQKQ